MTIYRQGTPVQLGEYKGTIVRHYEGHMYEVRLPGGVACYEVRDTDIIQSDSFWYRECQRLQNERDEWERRYLTEQGWNAAITD